MPFTWVSTPQLPPPILPEPIPPNAISSEVNVVANTVNVNGTLLYNTAAVGYNVVYPSVATATESNTFATINISFANLTTATIGTLNASFANLTTANILSLNSASANITTLYQPTIVGGVVSADPTSPLGIASKEYVDSHIHPFSGSAANTGQIERFAGFIPNNWIQLLQQNVSRTTYPNLFSNIGTYYGSGDGANTFGLPTDFEDFMSSTTTAFTYARLPVGRFGGDSILIPDGRILLVGGQLSGNAVTIATPMSSGNVIFKDASLIITGGFSLASRPIALLVDSLKVTNTIVQVAGSDGINKGTVVVTANTITDTSITTTQLPSFYPGPESGTFGNPDTLADNTISVLPIIGRVVGVAGRVTPFGGGAYTAYANCYVGWPYNLPSGAFDIQWFRQTPDFPEAVYGHRQETLSDGTIFVAGGLTNFGTHTSNTFFGTVSLISNTITWLSGTALPLGLAYFGMKQLSDGRLLIVGGETTGNVAVKSTYFGTISGTTITWVQSNDLSSLSPFAAAKITMAIADDGSVWVFGGTFNNSVQVFRGIISGNTIAWEPGIELRQQTMNILSDGRILVVGGSTDDSQISNTFFGEIQFNRVMWTPGQNNLPVARSAHAATILADNRILVVGGFLQPHYYANTYLGTINGTQIAWVESTPYPAGNLAFHQLVTLQNGGVLGIGGFLETIHGAIANVYYGAVSGNSITWTRLNDLTNARYAFGASVLSDGRVFAEGGTDGTAAQAQTYVGIVTGNTVSWSTGSVLPLQLSFFAQTILPDGRILISGGTDANGVFQSNTYFGEVNPTGNLSFWKPTLPLLQPRASHSLIYRSDGTAVHSMGIPSDGFVRGDSFVYKMLLVGIKT